LLQAFTTKKFCDVLAVRLVASTIFSPGYSRPLSKEVYSLLAKHYRYIGMIRLLNYLNDDNVLFLHAENKEEVLKKLVEEVSLQKKLLEKDQFYEAILERENLVSTGVGMGVAIPHAKLGICKDFFISIAVLDKGVEWDSIDGSLVRLVFLIGGPENRQTEYLKILSLITSAIKDENLRKHLLTASSSKAFMHILRSQLSS
jgi:nitrogen PTS system EIIA component